MCLDIKILNICKNSNNKSRETLGRNKYLSIILSRRGLNRKNTKWNIKVSSHLLPAHTYN